MTEMEEISKSLKLNMNVWNSSAFDVWKENNARVRGKGHADVTTTETMITSDVIADKRLSNGDHQTVEFSEVDFDSLKHSSKDLTPKAKKLPFGCPHCDKSFPVSFALKNHISKHHKTSSPASAITILNCRSVQEVTLIDDVTEEVQNQPNVVTEDAEIQEVRSVTENVLEDETEIQNKNSKIVHPPEVESFQDHSSPNQTQEPDNPESMVQIDIHATSHQRTEDEEENAAHDELDIELNFKMDSSRSHNDDEDDFLEISDYPSEESEIDDNEVEEEESNHLEREMQPTLTTSGQKCPLCYFTSAEIKDLKVHLGMAHYNERIIEMNGKFDEQCAICAMAGPKNKGWIIHMILGHNVLANILPENILQLLSEDKTQRPAVTTNDVINAEQLVTSYKCHLCKNKVLSSYKGILNHYASFHFKAELFVLISKEGKNKCGVCFKKFSTDSHLLIHILRFHEPLIGMLPEKSKLEITTSKKSDTSLRTLNPRAKCSRKTESRKSNDIL